MQLDSQRRNKIAKRIAPGIVFGLLFVLFRFFVILLLFNSDKQSSVDLHDFCCFVVVVAVVDSDKRVNVELQDFYEFGKVLIGGETRRSRGKRIKEYGQGHMLCSYSNLCRFRED